MLLLGPLLAVGDLRATSDGTSVTLSWTPPFSLDVTGVEHDIWYSVFIYNVTDENNPTAILCTNCTDITETHYTFTPDYLSPCHVYNFSVIPLNGAGEGESSGNGTWDGEYYPAIAFGIWHKIKHEILYPLRKWVTSCGMSGGVPGTTHFS